MDPTEQVLGVKHPLANEWSFWLFTNSNKANWEDNLVELTTFDTVEDYWCLYHHMKLPSELINGQDYAIFKKGITPKWEDEANKSGGRWLIMVDGMKNDQMNRIWLDTVLLIIGENFKNMDALCGVVINIRNKNKLSVWTNKSDRAAILEIGTKLKKHFNFRQKMFFYLHNSTKSMYSV